MPVYIVTGKLGTGKGKYAVVKMREALLAGKRVATNFDLSMEHLTGLDSRCTATRVPDKPTGQDLIDIGHGNPHARHDEEQNGVLVLDELGSWLNSRTFGGPERAALLDFLIHARKHGWDCYLIVQNLDMIDKQVRLGLAEYLVKCIRLDKVKLPFVGAILGKRGRLPKMHMASVQLQDCPGVVIDREWYQAKDLHAAYDTLQIFRDWVRDPGAPGFLQERFAGPYSYLSGWHVHARHQPDAKPKPGLLARFFSAPPRPPLKPKLPAVELAASLPPEQAWAAARRYVEGFQNA